MKNVWKQIEKHPHRPLVPHSPMLEDGMDAAQQQANATMNFFHGAHSPKRAATAITATQAGGSVVSSSSLLPVQQHGANNSITNHSIAMMHMNNPNSSHSPSNDVHNASGSPNQLRKRPPGAVAPVEAGSISPSRSLPQRLSSSQHVQRGGGGASPSQTTSNQYPGYPMPGSSSHLSASLLTGLERSAAVAVADPLYSQQQQHYHHQKAHSTVSSASAYSGLNGSRRGVPMMGASMSLEKQRALLLKNGGHSTHPYHNPSGHSRAVTASVN